MHCGVMVTATTRATGSASWRRTTAVRPRCRTRRTWTTRSTWVSSSSLSGSTPSGRPSTTAPPTRCSRIRFSTSRTGRDARAGRHGDGCHRGPVVESRPARERDLHAGHPAQGPPPSPRDRARHRSPRVRLARIPDRRIARVLLRCDRRPPGGRRRRALHLRRQGLQDSADHHSPPGAAQGRSHHAHQGGVHHRGLRAHGRRERARTDVRRRRGPRRDDRAGAAVQHDPGRDGAAAGPAHHAAVDVLRGDRLGGRGGLGVLPQPAPRRPAPLLRVEQPGLPGIPGYEEYLKRQTADVGVADAGLAARRATQPIGTPDEIIEKIRALQHALSLEMVVIHLFYGGMPRAKAEKSLRLFAEKVLPAVQAMPTPINPASLGQPRAERAAPPEVSRLRPLSALAVESCVTAYNRPTAHLQTRHGGTLDAQ